MAQVRREIDGEPWMPVAEHEAAIAQIDEALDWAKERIKANRQRARAKRAEAELERLREAAQAVVIAAGPWIEGGFQVGLGDSLQALRTALHPEEEKGDA